MIIKLALVAMSAVAATPAPVPTISTSAVAAANVRFAARCARPPLDIEGLLSDAAFRSDLAASNNDEGRELLDYASCRALQGTPGVCSSLDVLGRGVGGTSTHCLALAAEDRFIFQTLRGGDALGACRKLLELEGKPGGSSTRACEATIAAVRAGNAAASCAVLKREKIIGPSDSCDDFMRTWGGSTQACAQIKDEDGRQACRGRAALVAGLKDPAKCASSPSCQVLVSKSPRACEGLGAKFSRALCARVSNDLSAEQKRLAQEKERSPEQMKARRLLQEKEVQAQAAKTAQIQAEAAAAANAKIEAMKNQVKEKAAKSAQAQAAAAAVVKAKAEVEAKKDAEAKAKIAKKARPQFRKGAPMQTTPDDAKAVMKAIEEGRPIPVKAKPKPKKDAEEEQAPDGQ